MEVQKVDRLYVTYLKRDYASASIFVEHICDEFIRFLAGTSTVHIAIATRTEQPYDYITKTRFYAIHYLNIFLNLQKI